MKLPSVGPLLPIYFLGGATRRTDALEELLLFAEPFLRLPAAGENKHPSAAGVLGRTTRHPPLPEGRPAPPGQSCRCSQTGL